jgi:hypothetical protein
VYKLGLLHFFDQQNRPWPAPWNGYTEGMAAVLTREHGDLFYCWLRSLD